MRFSIRRRTRYRSFSNSSSDCCVGQWPGDHDLLDLGPRLLRLAADHRHIDRHLAPAVDRIARLDDHAFDDRPARLLRAEIGARQEDHPDRRAGSASRDAPTPGSPRRRICAAGRCAAPRRRRSCRRHRPRRDATPPSAHRSPTAPRAATASRRSPRRVPTPHASDSNSGRYMPSAARRARWSVIVFGIGLGRRVEPWPASFSAGESSLEPCTAEPGPIRLASRYPFTIGCDTTRSSSGTIAHDAPSWPGSRLVMKR